MTTVQSKTNNKWLILWMTLNILAPICSFIGGYGFVFVFALFHPLAQMLALLKIQHAKYVWLWMLHFIYWIFLLLYIHDYNNVIIAVLASSVLGQLLLRIILGSVGNFNYVFWNTAALGVLIISTYLSSDFRISNDFLQVSLIVLTFAVSSFLSGMGIITGYLKSLANNQ